MTDDATSEQAPDDEGVTDRDLLHAALPLTITDAIPHYPTATLTGPDWRLDLDCDWALTTPAGRVTGEHPRDAFTTAFATLTGRTIIRIDCEADAYDPVLTLDDGSTLEILGGKDNDPWHWSIGDTVDLEGPDINTHDDFLAGNWNYLPDN